jgi:FkbM family methyltransferase
MQTELIYRPRLLFTKLLRRYCMSHHSEKLQMLMRNKVRKWCVNEELRIPTKSRFWMNVSPKDYATYGIYFFGTYDPSMTSVFAHLIKPGETVWDVGTERGWFTLQMGKLVGPTGRVDSFEAFPATCQKLASNVSMNKMNWVNVNCVGVSNTNGKMWFVPPSNSVTHHVSFLNECNGIGYLTDQYIEGAIEINTISLDDYYLSQNINRLSLIKIDIEGAEVNALRGARNLIAKDKPIIAIEFNRETAVRAGSSVEELEEILVAYGYVLYLFKGQFIPFKLNDFAGDFVLNVYCFPKKELV